MGQRIRVAAAAIVLAAALPSASPADTLWPSTPPNNNNSLYNDRKASQVGDIVTILVQETVSGRHESRLNTSKAATLSGQAGLAFWFGPQMPVSSFGAGGQEGLDGRGAQRQSGELFTRTAARVVEILPDGNLRVKAHKMVVINDERQMIELSGIIRPQDIRGDNTVVSMNVADAQIDYVGKGPISEKARPGILTRIADWLLLL